MYFSVSDMRGPFASAKCVSVTWDGNSKQPTKGYSHKSSGGSLGICFQIIWIAVSNPWTVFFDATFLFFLFSFLLLCSAICTNFNAVSFFKN
jgi:hypothetical protein